MAHPESLAVYRRKRDFQRTGEPAGGTEPPGDAAAFVVQVHDASRMHFDFRLEADGVLKSWAVPKGPCQDPRTKRLATPTEDHPLEYRTFEGVIDQGEYGGGTVMVWDEGTYRNLTTGPRGGPVPLTQALQNGHASFWLEGRKLHGGYALTRMGEAGGKNEAWLLVKKSDQYAGALHDADPFRLRSARSGRTLRQIAAAEANR